ncbi:MAG: AEC family transporter [Clostridia bacterium]|nr:AEC family transporter [Clostridia bacterium]
MDVFGLTLKQMLTMFTLILVGYVLRKKTDLAPNADKVIAKLETFVFGPALLLHVQSSQCTIEAFQKDYVLLLYGLCIAVCAILLSYPLSGLFVPKAKGDAQKEYSRNIYKYALTFGNYGFMGMFIIKSVFGEEMLYKHTLFTSLIEMVCLVWGMYVLVPKDQNASFFQNLKNALLKPQIIALFSGIILGLTGLAKLIPGFVSSALKSAGDVYGPLAMILAGVIIAGYDVKQVFANAKIYLLSLFRLILLPALILFVLDLLHTPKEIMTLALFTFATPIGLNTIVFPTAFGGDPKNGASMVMVSSTLSMITLPVMYLIYIVLL